MAHKIISVFRPGEEMVQPVSATREIKVPLSVLPKLISATDVYNPVLDSNQTNEISQAPVTQPEMIIGEQTVSSEATNNIMSTEPEFSKPVDVALLLSGNVDQKVEEPAVSLSQGINLQPISAGEPAYGGEAKPVDNVIQFPNMSQESVKAEASHEDVAPVVNTIPNNNVIQFPSSNQDVTQNLDELGDALARMEEALPLINTLFEQVKAAYEKSKGTTEEYRKVA